MGEKEIIFSMSWANIIAIVGVFITLALGIYNTVQQRLTTNRIKYIDTVTMERIKWLEKLRTDISRFSGLTSFWMKSLSHSEGKESHELLKEIDILRVMIKLRLNPDGKYDKEIIKLLDIIPTLTNGVAIKEIDSKLGELTQVSQKLLKVEWERVKDESKKGNEVPTIIS